MIVIEVFKTIRSDGVQSFFIFSEDRKIQIGYCNLMDRRSINRTGELAEELYNKCRKGYLEESFHIPVHRTNMLDLLVNTGLTITKVKRDLECRSKYCVRSEKK